MYSFSTRVERRYSIRQVASSLLALACVTSLVLPAAAEGDGSWIKKRKQQLQQQQQTPAQSDDSEPIFGSAAKKPLLPSQQPLTTPVITNFNNAGSGGKATTETAVVADRGVMPMLTPASAVSMQTAVARYENIVASGGWPTVSGKKLSKGDQGDEVTILKRRLVAEAYLPSSTLEGEKGVTFTDAAETAVKQFQANNGLAVTGKVDKATVAALNVPATTRLAALRANLPRVAEYTRDLGPRYIIVNVPALQLEAVDGGHVYSRHNIIAGKPERPSPIVMTSLSDINFNPYWNVPVSIVERDLLPQILKSGTQTLKKQNIRIFDGYQGPEVDPDDVDWSVTPADRYFFRQDPGKENAMATVKINFPSPFGVYMHDTPTRSLFGNAGRYLSSGCVRVEKVDVLVNWILNGQEGWNMDRIHEMAQTLERLDVKLAAPPQVRWVYLTAWINGAGQANFRNDIYDLDNSGFIVGQPMPVGEYSNDGKRFVLKPVPRAPSAEPVDSLTDDSFDIFDTDSSVKKPSKSAAKAKPASTLGFSTVQQSPTAKKKVTAGTTKLSSNSALAKTRSKSQAQKGAVASVDSDDATTAKVIKKKKKSVEAASADSTVANSKPVFGQN